jgi:hypothetical protein
MAQRGVMRHALSAAHARARTAEEALLAGACARDVVKGMAQLLGWGGLHGERGGVDRPRGNCLPCSTHMHVCHLCMRVERLAWHAQSWEGSWLRGRWDLGPAPPASLSSRDRMRTTTCGGPLSIKDLLG